MARGDRVRALREARGLSQSSLAARTGTLDQSYIAKIEAGRNQASSFHVREALAGGFGLPLDTFVAYLDGRTEMDALSPTIAPSPSSIDVVRPAELDDDTVVSIRDPSGRATGVPLRDLIRAYRFVLEMGGFDAVDRAETRVLGLEQVVAGWERRSERIERRQAKLEKALEKALEKVGKSSTRRK